MDKPLPRLVMTVSADIGEALLAVQLLRRRMITAQEQFSNWPPDMKVAICRAEERLKAMSGLDLAKSLVNHGMLTGKRVRI